MNNRSERIIKSFLNIENSMNEFFYVNYNLVKPIEPLEPKDPRKSDKKINKLLPQKQQQILRCYKQEKLKFEQAYQKYENDQALFAEEMNSFLNKLFREIFQNEQKFVAMKKIKYVQKSIQKNVCFLIGSQELWSYEHLFKQMNCNVRSKEYKLDDYRIQESPFKNRDLELYLRIVKPYSQRNGERPNNKLGDFILLQITEIQNSQIDKSLEINFYDNSIQKQQSVDVQKEGKNKMPSLADNSNKIDQEVKIEYSINSDEDKIQLNQQEQKKIPNTSILSQSKAISKDKNYNNQNKMKEAIVDSSSQENFIISINNNYQERNQRINQNTTYLKDSYQECQTNNFKLKEEPDDDDNYYHSLKKEELIKMLKEKIAKDDLQYIEQAIQNVNKQKEALLKKKVFGSNKYKPIIINGLE
ncbi:hypothetical protein ABPG74_009397 [Tetrahymena malaccensis]